MPPSKRPKLIDSEGGASSCEAFDEVARQSSDKTESNQQKDKLIHDSTDQGKK